MKYIFFFVSCIYLFSVHLIAQNDFDGEQLIQSSNGQNEITFEILDFENNDPLIFAEIFSREHNKVLANANLDGKAIIAKYISKDFRIDCFGYASYCFKLNDTTFDHIIIRLIPIRTEPDYIHEVKDKYLDKIFPYKSIDALKDLDSGKIQLFSYSKPTKEQQELANSYAFNFINDNNKSSKYKFNYNEEVLDFLNKKHKADIRSMLLEICWRNIK